MTDPIFGHKNMGRPYGSSSRMTQRAREEALKTGILPHEWLLKISRGEPIEQKHWEIKYDKVGKEVSRTLITEEVYATFPDRIDAAKSAAPYYAPRLAMMAVTPVGTNIESVVDTLKNLAARLPV